MPPFTHYLHPTADQGAPTPHHHCMEAHHASLCGKEPEKGETPPPTRNLPLPQTGLEMSALLARKRREGEKVSAIGPHPPKKNSFQPPQPKRRIWLWVYNVLPLAVPTEAALTGHQSALWSGGHGKDVSGCLSLGGPSQEKLEQENQEKINSS